MAEDKLAKRKAKEQREIERWERELERPRGAGYL